MVKEEFIMEGFSINNWLKNSGLSITKQNRILDLHLNADRKIKEAYNMKINGRNILIDVKNVILVATK